MLNRQLEIAASHGEAEDATFFVSQVERRPASKGSSVTEARTGRGAEVFLKMHRIKQLSNWLSDSFSEF